MQEPKICLICNDEIKSRRAYIYCGTTCRNIGIAKTRPKRLGRHPKWREGSKTDSSGYFLVKHESTTRKDGYIQEHVLVVEQHIGRKLRKDEDVHHINENKKDNELKNLCLMTRSAHMRYHALRSKRSRDAYGRFHSMP